MFDSYCKTIMQPKKITYNRADLECGVPRKDFILQGLQCSLYKCNKNTQTCVLYLHGYNGSRLEAVPYAQQICKYDMDFCSFDFQAAGLSVGELVTFGIKEEENIATLVSYLKDSYQYIVLWGRSMGATTALMYSLKNPTIKCLVLDSPFVTLEDVILNLIKQKLHTPDLINKGLYELISRQITNKYQFCIGQVQLPQVLKIDCPMLLLASKFDNLIPYHHFTQLMKSYIGPRRMVQLQCNHNEQRPRDIIQTVLGFILSMSPKTKFSPTRYPHRLLGDMEQHQYVASGIKIKQKIMRNNSASNHSKNSAQIQKDRALFQLSNLK